MTWQRSGWSFLLSWCFSFSWLISRLGSGRIFIVYGGGFSRGWFALRWSIFDMSGVWYVLTLPFRILWVLIMVLLTISDDDYEFEHADWGKENMKIEPNEKKKVKHEIHDREILVWNRRRKYIYVHYTVKGLEIHWALRLRRSGLSTLWSMSSLIIGKWRSEGGVGSRGLAVRGMGDLWPGALSRLIMFSVWSVGETTHEANVSGLRCVGWHGILCCMERKQEDRLLRESGRNRATDRSDSQEGGAREVSCFGAGEKRCPVDQASIHSIIIFPDNNQGLVVTCRLASENNSRCPKGNITCNFYLNPERRDPAIERRKAWSVQAIERVWASVSCAFSNDASVRTLRGESRRLKRASLLKAVRVARSS